MELLRKKSTERAAGGKKTAFRIGVGKREVSQAALDHYFRRKKSSKVAVRRKSSPEPQTPPHIECYTPPDTPSPGKSSSSSSGGVLTPSTASSDPVRSRQASQEIVWLPGSPAKLKSPAHYKTMEVVLYSTQDFYLSTIQVTDGVDNYHVANQSMTWNMRRFYVLAGSVASHMAEGSWQEAQTAYGETIDHVGPVLRDHNPILLVCLLQICCKFSQGGQLPALRPLLQLIRGMSAHVDSVSNPIYMLCGALLQSMEVLDDMMILGLRQAFDILKDRLGMAHPQTCAAGRGLHTSLMTKGDHAGALEAFQPVADVEDSLQNTLTIESLNRIIGSHLCLMHLHKAKAMIEKSERLVATLDDKEKRTQFTLCALSTRGEFYRLQRDPRAIGVLTEAYNFAKTNTWLHGGSWTVNARKALRTARSGLNSDKPLVPFVFWF